jgi:hypothetical protein
MQCFPRSFVPATEEMGFVNRPDCTFYGSTSVPRVDQGQGHPHYRSEFGRIICYEDFNRQNIFGWISVSIDSEDYPINHRSLSELTPSLVNPFSLHG